MQRGALLWVLPWMSALLWFIPLDASAQVLRPDTLGQLSVLRWVMPSRACSWKQVMHKGKKTGQKICPYSSLV